MTSASADLDLVAPPRGRGGGRSGAGDVGGGDRVPPSHGRVSMLVPDFPFSYDDWLAHPSGLGAVPERALGVEVAVVGAGMSGVVVAYELMRLGLRPVVYEATQVGGRLRSVQMGEGPGLVADLGGMRFPASAKAFRHYTSMLGVRTAPFPNPLSPAAPSTVVDVGGEVHYATSLADLPPVYAEVAQAWSDALAEVGLPELQRAIAERDTAAIKAVWDPLVARFDELSFYGFIAASTAFAALPFAHRELFGQVGFGTGGWDTDFPHTILEILRVVATDADSEHERLLGGAQQVPVGLWHRPLEEGEGRHWPAGTSLASLHRGAPLPGVTALHRSPDGEGGEGSVVVTDRWGTQRAASAVVVTCQCWLLSASIDTEEELFDVDTWMAMDRSHYAQSSKTFVMVDRPFWHDVDPATGQRVLSTTLTDRMTRATYLLEDVDDEGNPRLDAPALICLSYTWNDDALKWLSMDPPARVRRMLGSLAKTYPGLDVARHVVGEPVTVSWESDPHFMGAFRGALPGHYRYQRRLFSHFLQDDLPAGERGVFLAGDDISFTPGWVEGAVTTGLNAVWGVVHHLGGRSAPDNPGPGDVFADLAPVDLDAVDPHANPQADDRNAVDRDAVDRDDPRGDGA